MDDIHQVRRSFARCTIKGDIVGRFYEIFLDSHPAIKPMFANTDLENQKKLLHHGINLTIMFAEGSPVGQGGIDRISQSHCRARMNINPDLYPHWKSSLLKAISEFDPEFNDTLRAIWDRVLQKSIDHISASYEKEVTV